jgi:hypothetical protein
MDEEQPAVVAEGIDPAGQQERPSDIRLGHLSAENPFMKHHTPQPFWRSRPVLGGRDSTPHQMSRTVTKMFYRLKNLDAGL